MLKNIREKERKYTKTKIPWRIWKRKKKKAKRKKKEKILEKEDKKKPKSPENEGIKENQ